MDKIEKFLSRYSNKQTQKTYRSHLTHFFNYIDKDSNTYIKNIERMDKQKRTEALNEYKEDIEKYWEVIRDNPPLTRHSVLSTIRTFLKRNDIEIKPLYFWQDLKASKAGKYAVTKSEVPTPDQLKEMLQYSDTKGRAFFLFLSSTGMRVNEALQLTENNFDFKYKIDGTQLTKIDIPAKITKTQESREVFCSPECTQALKAWQKIRKDYLKAAIERCNFPNHHCKKSKNDNTFFCYSYGTVRAMWYRLLEKSGNTNRDQNTSRQWRTMHIHVLRKYYRHNLSHKAGRDCAELLMGHRDSLGNVYRDYPTDELARMYLKGIPDISVFEREIDTLGLSKNLQDKDETIKEMQKRIESMDQDIRRLTIKLLTENDTKKN